MKKEKERRLRVSSYKSRNKTAFCQNFCTGAVRGTGRVGHGDDDQLRGRRGLVKEGEESKRVRALCFWEWGKPGQGRSQWAGRVHFVRFWAEKNAPLPE